MKIMIDIPEQIYQNAKDDMLCGSELIVNAIKKGTPIEQERCECFTCKYGEWKRKGLDITMADDKCGGCCSWNDKYEPLKQERCEACISRAEAIYLADELKHDLPDNDKVADEVMAHNEAILEYQTKLSLLPSVQPKTETGHWIWCGGSHECSNCEEYTCFSHKKPLRYCPNCGAKMEARDNANK